MRKADNTIVFGSQNTPSTEAVPPSIPIPDPEPPMAVRMRPLADDLVDERRFMGRPERGLAFVAASIVLLGVAAAGTYFFFGTRGPVVSTTTTTGAPTQPAATASAATPTPAPAPTTTPAEQPWTEPEVDAVRAPGLHKTQVPREIPGPQLAPTERPQAEDQEAPPAPPPTTYASKIEGAKRPSVPTAKRIPPTPPPGMSDEALERAGYYGIITPIAPTTTANAGEPKPPSAASTEEPSQFTPPADEVMP